MPHKAVTGIFFEKELLKTADPYVFRVPPH